MERYEAEQRDRVLRGYFEGRDWDSVGEFALKREMVRRSHELIPDLPYVVDDEWEAVPGHAQAGRGDLVFADGRGRYAAVEVKYINGGAFGGSSRNASGTRRKKRRKVEEQAISYAAVLRQRHPDATEVRAYIWTNNGGLRRLDRASDEDLSQREG